MRQEKRPPKKKEYRIAVLPGDGIGPEVIREGLKVVRTALKLAGKPHVEFEELKGGAGHYRDTGIAFPEESRKACWEADAIFFGRLEGSNVSRYVLSIIVVGNPFPNFSVPGVR